MVLPSSFPIWGRIWNLRADMEGDQNMSLWRRDYFETKAIEDQQLQKSLPVGSNLSSNFWEIRIT